jgi:hypothetical protein
MWLWAHSGHGGPYRSAQRRHEAVLAPVQLAADGVFTLPFISQAIPRAEGPAMSHNAHATVQQTRERTPELNLWRAVIEQHLQDGANNLPSVRRNRDAAREWFAGRGMTYRYVCDLAGFDPDQLANKALALFATADQAPQKPPPAPPTARKDLLTIEYNGERKSFAAWARQYGLPVRTLRSRVKLGWTMHRALTAKTPGVAPDSLEGEGTGGGSEAQYHDGNGDFVQND